MSIAMLTPFKYLTTRTANILFPIRVMTFLVSTQVRTLSEFFVTNIAGRHFKNNNFLSTRE